MSTNTIIYIHNNNMDRKLNIPSTVSDVLHSALRYKKHIILCGNSRYWENVKQYILAKLQQNNYIIRNYSVALRRVTMQPNKNYFMKTRDTLTTIRTFLQTRSKCYVIYFQ